MKRQFANDEQWLAFRQTPGLITATDSAAICGVNKYKSRYAIWAQKTGRFEPKVWESAGWGLILEEPIRKEYARVTGRKVTTFRRKTIYTHPDLPWMAATPDGRIAPGGTYEGKTCSLMLRGDWVHGIPLAYQFQGQHQMACMGTTWNGFACLVGGQELVWHDLPRDDIFIENLQNELIQFRELLLSDTPPPIDGTDSTCAALAAVYNKPKSEELWMMDDEIAMDVASRRQLLLNTADVNTAAAQEIDNQIKALMGNFEVAYLPDGTKVTWRANKNGVRVFKVLGK